MNSRLKIMMILMWRHFLVRKHKYIWTTLELLSTIILFVFMYANRSSLNSLTFDKVSNKTNNTSDPLNIPLDYIPPPSRVLYSPTNNEIDVLMNEVAKDLDVIVKSYTTPTSHVENFGDEKNEDYEEDNINATNNIINEIFTTTAIVKFKNLSYFPEQLEYSIWMENNKGLQIFSKDKTLGFNAAPFFKPSLRLQWTIDKIFLQKLTGETIKQDVYLKEVPYKMTTYSLPNKWMIVSTFLKSAVMFGLFLPYVFTASRVLDDRLSGVMELINVAGASRMMLLYSHFLNDIPACLLFSIGGTMCLKVGGILPNTDGLLLFLMLSLHSFSIMTAAMLSSFISNIREYGESCSTLLYVMSDYLFRKLITNVSDKMLPLAYALSFFIPNGPIYWFYEELFRLEQIGSGVTKSTIYSKLSERNIPVIGCFFMLLLQIVLYFVLLAYLKVVRPGSYGTAKPWNFFCKKTVEWLDTGETRHQDPRYFEDAPKGKDVGVKVIRVSKAYKNNVVLDDVTMDIYKGDITVFLGHNGAGKTTLMNVITGMTSPSAGEVLVNGEPSTHEIRRREMGLCPQHNIFLPSLTVIEHVRFFAMLKGQSYEQAEYSSILLLEELGLKNKAKTESNRLSGGMKRRLQLACALSGNTSVLVLDEPTSGLDVETRRELWNLLLKLRGSRTTLLSTHFMEEADALGDRVAAISHGQLVCYATPLILKSNVDTGYILTISTVGKPDESHITQTVLGSLPEANLRELSPNSVTYNLPTEKSSQFPQLFKSLESQKEGLGINTMGVGMPTLEEVFHKLCSNVSYEDEETSETVRATSFNLISPPYLYLRQTTALLKRLVMYIWRAKIYFLLFNALLPLGVIYLFTAMPINKSKQYKESRSMDLGGHTRRRVYFNVNEIDIIDKFSKQYNDSEFFPSSNVIADIKNLSEYNASEKSVIGLNINSTTIQIFYIAHVNYAASDALNLASNAILNQLLARRAEAISDNFTINIYNKDAHTTETHNDHKDLIEALIYLLIKIWIILLLFFTTVSTVGALLKQELQENTRWLHIMAGCPVILHWFSRLLFHIFQYTLTLVIPIIVMLAFFDKSGLFSNNVLGVFTLILFLSLISWLTFIYLLSLTLLSPSVLFILCQVGLLIGFLDCLLYNHETSDYFAWRSICLFAYLLLPPDVGCQASVKTILISFVNNGTENVSFFEWCDRKPLPDMCYLAVQSVYQMALVVCIEEGCGLVNIINKLRATFHKPHEKRYNDANVIAETEYVKKTIANPNKKIPDIMLVNKIYKTYLKLCVKPVHAVNGLSFSVKKGECFGLLGVNGAGKSTAFKVITAETHTTKGRVWTNGHFLKTPHGKYLKSLSYCPQFLGVDTFLTGRQNLSLILKIRGLSDADIKRETYFWLEVVGLEKLQNLPLDVYSGGCKRRISTACSLCSAAPLTLMDEPTSGVDVTARRRVWYAVRRALKDKRAIVITSHSMDEMEALCGRVGIMSDGEMCALGNVPELRAQHAAGFSLRLKINTLADAKQNKDLLKSLKSDLTQSFACTQKDDHETMLHYHIDETMPYSELFTKLEDLKSRHKDFIENYTVSETTLEEVFLSFAKINQLS